MLDILWTVGAVFVISLHTVTHPVSFLFVKAGFDTYEQIVTQCFILWCAFTPQDTQSSNDQSILLMTNQILYLLTTLSMLNGTMAMYVPSPL